VLGCVAGNDAVVSFWRKVLGWRLCGCLGDKGASAIGKGWKREEGEEVAGDSGIWPLVELVVDTRVMGLSYLTFSLLVIEGSHLCVPRCIGKVSGVD
jgi:hypothetical protein